MKCLIDNIAIFAVEILLVQQLENFLSPSQVIEMPPDLIEMIAIESPGVVAQREQYTRKLDVLVAGMEVCRRGIRGKDKSQN